MTTQAQDILIFQKKDYALNNEILWQYFDKFPDKYFNPQFSNTSLWRGYIATFQIKGDKLFVKSIKLLAAQSTFKKLNDFPYNEYCYWYSGFIRIDDNKGCFNSENNKDAIYEFLAIKNGILQKYYKFNYLELRNFRLPFYRKYIKTQKYINDLNVWINLGESMRESKKIVCDFFMEYYISLDEILPPT